MIGIVVVDNDKSNLDKIKKVFEKEENGSSIELEKFIIEAKDNYDIAVKDMLYKMPGITPLELITKKTVFKVKSFISNIRREVRQGFKSHRLRAILEFPVLFLGAKASNTPAFYSFMNYADFGLGTWQPKNGFYDVVQSMLDLGKSLGVQYKTECNVESILIENKKVKIIQIKNFIILLFPLIKVKKRGVSKAYSSEYY